MECTTWIKATGPNGLPCRKPLVVDFDAIAAQHARPATSPARKPGRWVAKQSPVNGMPCKVWIED